MDNREYFAKVQKRFGDVFEKVREKKGQSHIRQKASYDRKVHGEKFNTGDLVWLWNPSCCLKKGLESYTEPGKDCLKLSSHILVPLTGSSMQQKEGNIRW